MKKIIFATGIFLLVAGGAALFVESAKRSSHEVHERLNKGVPVNAEELKAQIQLHERLAQWGWHDAELLKTVALAEYSLSHLPGTAPRTSQRLLSSAINHISQGLALSPADPDNWLRLAHMRFLANTPPRKAIDALTMSVMTGPAISYLIAPRIKLALVLWDHLKKDEKAMFLAQMALLKRWDPSSAAALAASDTRLQ